ncbi:MAG TPA: DUF3810 family protein [Terriglobia bacterium]|jgi:hypothetical protein
MVKRKTGILHNFTVWRGGRLVWVFPLLAILTFIFSWVGAYPSGLVERWYARGVFPHLSHFAGRFADAVSFAWLDPTIVIALVLLVGLVWKRRWTWLVNIVAVAYLAFFWSWGLNYHRPQLASKLQVDSARTTPPAIDQFARHAAAELNRLYPEKEKESYDEGRVRSEAAARVRRVVDVIDGSDWEAAHRIKISRLADPWMHAAGIDGVFNPLAHEPVISNTLLDVEKPFVISHELAHVRGYPDEGDANVIAVFATMMSNDPAFEYSGWLNLWLYLRTRELDKLLDPGPRNDIQRIVERARGEEIAWINDFQRSLLDWFLKANNVGQGVRSYSRVVIVAAGTEPFWEHFR